jgi:flagellar biosynthesis GTPase FlhF
MGSQSLGGRPKYQPVSEREPYNPRPAPQQQQYQHQQRQQEQQKEKEKAKAAAAAQKPVEQPPTPTPNRNATNTTSTTNTTASNQDANKNQQQKKQNQEPQQPKQERVKMEKTPQNPDLAREYRNFQTNQKSYYSASQSSNSSLGRNKFGFGGMGADGKASTTSNEKKLAFVLSIGALLYFAFELERMGFVDAPWFRTNTAINFDPNPEANHARGVPLSFPIEKTSRLTALTDRPGYDADFYSKDGLKRQQQILNNVPYMQATSPKSLDMNKIKTSEDLVKVYEKQLRSGEFEK